jgi:hypothetical protein
MSTVVNSTPGDRTMFTIAAFFNWVVAASLAAPGDFTWKLLGMAMPEQKLFVHLAAWLIAAFGLAYWWVARDPSDNRPLIQLSVIGKLGVFALAVAHLVFGSLPLMVFGLSIGDLVFAVLFIRVLRRA